MPSTAAVLALVFLPFVAAAATPLVYRVLGERTAYYAAAVALACFGLVASLYGSHGAVVVEWIPSLGVSLAFYVDGLSLLIAFLASGVGVLILTYSGGYMHGESSLPKYYATLLAFMGSMLGVALAADLISLFLFWEFTSLSSFILIGHYTEEADSQYAARKSMLITVAGGLFMLVGFLLLADVAGTFQLAGTSGSILSNAESVRAGLEQAGLLLPVLILLAMGAATKSAQVPFHVWLPNAMEAPTPVSAFLHSATMVKAGVYLVGRFRPLYVPKEANLLAEWSLLFVVLGLLTMTVAAILAVAATDIKELLAYSTASHLGLIVAGFGFAEKLGAETGAFHILNHATFKATLFLVAGIVAHEAGTRKIEDLRGLRHDLPITAVIAALASLSMAGIPPFNGFYSKELLFDAAWETAAHVSAHGDGAAATLVWLFPAVAVFGSVFTFLYSIRFLWLFLGERSAHLTDHHVHRPPVAMLVPPAILAVLVAVISVRPSLATGFIVNDVFAATANGVEHATVHAGLPTHLSPPVLMSAVTILLGAVTFPFYDRLHAGINRLLRGPVRANWWYDGGVRGLTRSGYVLTPVVQNEQLRTFAFWTLGATALLALGGYLAAGVALPALAFAQGMTVAIGLVLLVAVVGAIAMLAAPSHIAGVLTLSIVGFMVAIFYILADAPDLALTQLVIETLVLVIFLLVLDRLPAFYGSIDRAKGIRDAALSALVGVTVFVSVLSATAASPAPDLREYLLVRGYLPEGHHAGLILDWGGGHNVVNVILVDFRGFDTMGEISVIAMAALAILTLLGMRGRGERE